MMHDKRNCRFGLAGVLTGVLLIVIGSAPMVLAQNEEAASKPTATKRVSSTGRDPFKKYEAPRTPLKKVNGLVVPPPLQERIEMYKAQKAAAMSARMPAPKPTTALLLNEIQVVGISRTPRGYAAIVEAMPIKLSYVIYPGEPFYDGQLVAIEDNHLVFRHESVFSDGRRERSVQLKPLRQPNQVNVMSTPAKPEPVSEAETPKKQDEKTMATAKP